MKMAPHLRSAVAAVATVVAASMLAVNGGAAEPYAYSCASDAANCCFDSTTRTSFRCEPDEDGSYPCAVRLGVSNWAGSFINVWLAKIFIEEYIGYPVEITANYTDYAGTESEQSVYDGEELVTAGAWEKMSNGVLDAVLEFWPSGHQDNIQKYVIDQGTIINAGQNGLEGRIGWFIPSYMVENTDPFLEYWRTYLTTANTDIFADPATERPCCVSNIGDQDPSLLPCMASAELGGTPESSGGLATAEDCDPNAIDMIPTTGGRFLAGIEDWSQHDEQIIRNLGLDLTIEFSGSEENSVQAVIDAHENEDPLLMYFWTPHGLFQNYNMTYVLLPLSTPECVAKIATGEADCGYPADLLAKAYSTAFAEARPDAAQFIYAMQYSSNTQQEEMLAALMSNASRTLNEVTCEWAKANEETWSGWTGVVEQQFSGDIWMGEDLEPTLVVCPCKSDATQEVVALYETSAYASDGTVTMTVDPSPCSAARNGTIYKTRWTTELLQTEVVEVLDCVYVPKDSVERDIILALAGLAVAIMFVCLLGAIAFRAHAAVRTARQKTLSLMLLGSALLNLAGIFEIGSPDPYKCGLRFSFMLFGFFFFVGTLLIKQFTIVSLMNSKYIMDRSQTQQKTFFLRYEIISSMLFCGVWLIIWTFVVGFEPVLSSVGESYEVYEYVCPTNTPLLMLIIALCYITVVISCILANQTRLYKGLIFREARFMLFSNYNVAILTAFCLFVVFTEGIPPVLKSLFLSICVFFCTVSCALLVVGTRLYAAYRDLPADNKIMETSTIYGNSFGASSDHSSHGVAL